MIKAAIFDLDGTLVQSERIKALCYHQAVVNMGRTDVSLERMREIYSKVVGQTRQVISRYIMEQLSLEPLLEPLMERYAVADPVAVLTAMRLQLYEDFISEDEFLRANVWPFTVELVSIAKSNAWRVGLATSSLTSEALRVLTALRLEKDFEAVVGLDQIKRGKPDPEVYLTAAALLGVPPEECLVIEDSPPGVAAGLAAGMNVIGVATPLTLLGLHETDLIDHDWIVHDPKLLLATVHRMIEHHNRTKHAS